MLLKENLFVRLHYISRFYYHSMQVYMDILQHKKIILETNFMNLLGVKCTQCSINLFSPFLRHYSEEIKDVWKSN